MTRKTKAVTDYEIELAMVDEELSECKAKVEKLIEKRDRLSDKLRMLDIATALEFIYDMGVPIDEILGIINKEISKRKKDA